MSKSVIARGLRKRYGSIWSTNGVASAPMKWRKTNIDELLRRGAAGLLARSSERRGLDAAMLLPRLRIALDKYLRQDQSEWQEREISESLDAIHADDLCLVIACEQGDEAAWRDLISRYEATVRSAARHYSQSEAAAEELAQSIWAELHGLRRSEGGTLAGKLGYYSGRGSLGGWLRAVVGQLAVDQHRRSVRLVQPEEAADFDHLAHQASSSGDGFRSAAPPDPERALHYQETARDLHDALTRTINELAPADRLLIKLYYFDNLRLHEAGRVLGVHEATASRRLVRVHREVRQRVEAILMKDHGWTPQETKRTLTEAAAHLDIDLRRVLAAETAETTTSEK